MNILVVTQYYYPEQFRITDICEELANRGHAVTVLTGVPNYPEGEIYSGYEEGKRKNEIINGVNVVRCENLPRHKGLYKLAKNYISFVIKANKEIFKLNQSFDIIFVYEISPITMAIPAINYKKRTRTPIYLYCMDVWPECVRDIRSNKTMSTKNPIYLTAYAVSKYVYNAVDVIGIKCEGFKEYLSRVCKVDESKMNLLFEHAEKEYLKVKDYPKESDSFKFFFLGNIGHSQNCKIIIDALEILKTDSKYQVHFVGEGSDKKELEEYVNNKGLNEIVFFHGKHPLEETIPFYEEADCCLLTLSNRTESGITLPGKIVGYMGASRPVIAAASGETKRIINLAKCGLCVEPEDVRGLAKAMGYAIEHRSELSRMGRNGRKFFVKNFTIDIFLDNLLQQFGNMVEGGDT